MKSKIKKRELIVRRLSKPTYRVVAVPHYTGGLLTASEIEIWYHVVELQGAYEVSFWGIKKPAGVKHITRARFKKKKDAIKALEAIKENDDINLDDIVY